MFHDVRYQVNQVFFVCRPCKYFLRRTFVVIQCSEIITYKSTYNVKILTFELFHPIALVFSVPSPAFLFPQSFPDLHNTFCPAPASAFSLLEL